MKTLISAVCVATLSLGSMAATMAPVQAASYSQNHSNKWQFEKRGDYAYLNGHRGIGTAMPGGATMTGTISRRPPSSSVR